MIGWSAAAWPERPPALRAGFELEIEILQVGQAGKLELAPFPPRIQPDRRSVDDISLDPRLGAMR